MKNDLQEQINELKKRIEVLEQRPIYYPVYPIQPTQPNPNYPQYPYPSYPVISH